MTLSTEPPASPLSIVTPNHHGNYYTPDIHSTPIRANLLHKEEWQSPLVTGYGPSPSSAHGGTPDFSNRETPYQNGHKSPQRVQRSHWPSDDLKGVREGGSWGREGGWKEAKPIPEFIPEEEGVQELYPSHHKWHTTRTTPPRLHVTQPELQLEPTKSSTFPREGSLSQPDKNTESVVDLLDEALEVLDEEEDQRKQRERQGAMKPWKPQHRGRFRLSLQDSSYYDYRLYNSYRHFNRNRAFHGSKQSSSSTHLNVDPSAEMVASAQLQESLVELSQTSDTAIDPHIRSFVFEGAHTEAGGATEL
jgi:hypothetical protein